MSVPQGMVDTTMTYDHDEGFVRCLESRNGALGRTAIGISDARASTRNVGLLAGLRLSGGHRHPRCLDAATSSCDTICLLRVRRAGPSAPPFSGQIITSIPRPR